LEAVFKLYWNNYKSYSLENNNFKLFWNFPSFRNQLWHYVKWSRYPTATLGRLHFHRMFNFSCLSQRKRNQCNTKPHNRSAQNTVHPYLQHSCFI